MEHEGFPVKGFEFMDNPATMHQKEIIVKLCDDVGTPVDMEGHWPEPFSRWDAYSMIKSLKEKRKEMRHESKRTR